jgi:hypothetical protein
MAGLPLCQGTWRGRSSLELSGTKRAAAALAIAAPICTRMRERKEPRNTAKESDSTSELLSLDRKRSHYPCVTQRECVCKAFRKEHS